MRGQEYKARDKTVRKMSRDGLLEENLHTRDSTRISQRELDVLELSGQERDSVNFQDVRYHRTDRKTGEKKRRRRYVPDSDGAGPENAKDFSSSEDFLRRDGGTGGTVQEPQPYRPMDRAEALQEKDLKKRLRMQQETRFREESDLEPETGFRLETDFQQESRSQTESESGQDTKLPEETGRLRRKRQLYERENPENITEIPDFDHEGSQPESEAMPAGKLSEHSSRMEHVHEKAAGSSRHRESSSQKIHDRKKKQVYEYAKREKKKKEAEEIQKAVSEREKIRYEKNLELTEQEPLQGDRKKRFSRLSFQDEEKRMIRGAGVGMTRKALSSSLHETAAFLHKKEREAEQENVAAESTHKAELAGESVLRNTVRMSSIAMKKRRSRKAGAAGISETGKRLQFVVFPEDRSPEGMPTAETDHAKKRRVGKYWQKQRIKKSYQKAKRGQQAVGETIKVTETVFEKAKRMTEVFFQKEKGLLGAVAVLGLFLLMVSAGLSSCGAMVQGASPTIIGTTYPSTDTDIYAVDAAYTALENALDRQINNMESTHPGYDEYRYQIDEISHNPYHLISYLTVVYQEFTYDQVKDDLAGLFSEQFRLTVEEIVETRTRTETRTSTDPVTGEESEYEVEVEYDYYILCIALSNCGFDAVARSHLTPEQTELYLAYNLTFGNRNYLFDVNALPPEAGGNAENPGYEIPEEALSDARFANMIREAEKYLGYPYVWGGASPTTSFDCSGFVCWVINHCGNGWNVGRTTAEGLRQHCSYVSPSEAKPGDLIFFQGTYHTSGASHVGIYVGNNRMIHCGNPIQYTNTSSQFWTGHFLSYGRIR